jgi:hypothetical protein
VCLSVCVAFWIGWVFIHSFIHSTQSLPPSIIEVRSFSLIDSPIHSLIHSPRSLTRSLTYSFIDINCKWSSSFWTRFDSSTVEDDDNDDADTFILATGILKAVICPLRNKCAVHIADCKMSPTDHCMLVDSLTLRRGNAQPCLTLAFIVADIYELRKMPRTKATALKRFITSSSRPLLATKSKRRRQDDHDEEAEATNVSSSAV